tara:strand:+ start:972 stop:1202 length:231 start_codon:yes stop_codon:yes gene_type:complete
MSTRRNQHKQEDVQDTLMKAGIEPLWKGVSKNNQQDMKRVTILNSKKQLLDATKVRKVKKWLSNTGQNLKKKLLKS